ncbi:MAG: PD40 domain-containing protein, partial [Pyrinomonadaceae bacterium]|nr:PD40 domain-containing protein [Pyrinomonadaceae bacterium]
MPCGRSERQSCAPRCLNRVGRGTDSRCCRRTGSPRVSLDGRFIFFTSQRSGATQVWRMNADGSNQTQLTNREGGYPRFVTLDGKWVYYEASLRQRLWKVAADGGEEMQVLDRKMYSPAFTPDGSLLAYIFHDGGMKIAVLSLADNKLLKVYT